MKLVKSQLSKNILSGTLLFGMNIIVNLISIPIYIKYVGLESFSLWSLISIVLSFGAFGNFGISTSIIKYIAIEYNNKNRSGVFTIMTNGLYIIIFFCIIIIFLFILFNGPIYNLLNLPIENKIELLPILNNSVFIVFFLLIADLIRGGVTGIGRIDLSNLILTFMNIVRFIIIVLFMHFEYGLLSFIWGYYISETIQIAILFFLFFKYLKIEFSFSLSFNLEIIKKLLSFGINVVLIQILNMFIFPSFKLILSHNFNIKEVGYFELASKVSYSIRSLFEKGLYAIVPDFSSKYRQLSQQNYYSVKNRISQLIRKIIIYVIPVYIMFVLLLPIILKLWLGNSYNPILNIYIVILLIGTFAGLISLPFYYAFFSLGFEKYCVLAAIVQAILCFSINFLIYFTKNIISLYVALVMSIILSNILVIVLFSKIKFNK